MSKTESGFRMEPMFVEEYWRKTDIQRENDFFVKDAYFEPHRFYHTLEHINTLIQSAKEKGIFDHYLYLAILYHDVVYDPQRNDNEEKSVEIFRSHYDGPQKEEIAQAILDTKKHEPSNDISRKLCMLDLEILHSDLRTQIDYENKIFKEYQYVDWKIYRERRVKVLRKYQNGSELENLIAYIETRKPNIGLYAGSFNPFHLGHYDILKKAEKIFDKVIIARGKNPEKEGNATFPIPEKLKFRQIEEYSGLLTDFIDETLKYDVTLIRGLRNASDLQYETTQLRFLQDLKPDIKVVSLFCDKEFEHLSSSSIKMLKKFNVDVDKKYLL